MKDKFNNKLKIVEGNTEAKLAHVIEENFEHNIEMQLNDMGWTSFNNSDFKRITYKEVIQWDELLNKIMTLNNIDEELAKKVIKEINKILNEPSYSKKNKTALDSLKYGIKIRNEKLNRTLNYKIVDLENPKKNSFQLIRQLEIIDDHNQTRKPDITLYINGIPLVVCEIKSALSSETVEDAYDQNANLFRQIPQLFSFNIMNFVSDNKITKYGDINSSFKYYGGWKKFYLNNEQTITPVIFLFEHHKILNFIKNFVFWSDGDRPVKYLAHPHQISAVIKEIEFLKNDNLAGRGGVIWHTQGSGKSVTMVFLTHAIQNEFTNSTIIMITDRNTLDDQLFSRFIEAKEYLQTQSVHISSRKKLKAELLNKKAHGIYFTTIEKLEEDTGKLSDRDNIYVICDEAHRTQNNIESGFVIDKKQKTIRNKKGFAAYLREAFPNATYIGFTGTPLLGQLKKQTTDIFGPYTDRYLLKQAQEDGTVLKIYYEGVATEIKLPKELKKQIDDLQENFKNNIKDENNEIQSKKLFELDKTLNSSLIMENELVIKTKAQHILKHYHQRENVLHGKAMIVSPSRKAAYLYFKTLIEIEPTLKDKIILILSKDNKDSAEIEKAMIPNNKMNEVEKDFKKDDSKYKIAIVCDKWLTGFDVPDLDCIYLDKILKWHNLMQAIARVNRVYENIKEGKKKEFGLVVDYNNIWKPLLEALALYSDTDTRAEFSIDEINLAEQKLIDALAIINENFLLGILSLNLTDKDQIYEFIIKNSEKIQELDRQQKETFLSKVRDINRYFKISFNKITKETKEYISIINITKQVALQREISCDDKLDISKKQLKQLIEEAFKNSTTNISVISKTFKKDITTVTDILRETDQLKDLSKSAAVEYIKNWLQKSINDILKIRPWISRQLSEKLNKILEKIKEHADVDKIIELLKNLAREYQQKINEPTEFEDEQLQAFFEILKSDNYFVKEYNNNSQELRNIAIDINNAIKGEVTDQFLVNSKVQNCVGVALIKTLKNKYNYPPSGCQQAAKEFNESIISQIKAKPIKVGNQE